MTYNQIFNGEKPHFPPLVKKVNPINYYISGKGKYQIIKTSYIYDGLVFSHSNKLRTLKKGMIIDALAVVEAGQTTRLKVMVEGKVGYISARKTIVQKVPDPVYHLVKKGETLTSIAEKYNTTVNKIAAFNKNIKNINLIYPGMKIRVK